MSSESIRGTVRKEYAEAANRVVNQGGACCGTAAPANDPITSNLYGDGETASLPAEAIAASLGCGNPTALAELKPGETVLDLGSGGGIDVILSARRVGPSGKAYVLDMTDEMLALASENQTQGERSERRVSQRRDRAYSAARQFRRRDHLELRDQPVGRQGPRAARGVSRA